MPDLADYLLRFRRILLPPGAPAPPPAAESGAMQLEAELAHLFEQIDEVAADADRIGREAEEQSARIRKEADEAYGRKLADARAQADEAYATSYTERVQALTAQFDEIARSAEKEAQRIRRVGIERAESIAEEVVATLLHPGDDSGAPKRGAGES